MHCQWQGTRRPKRPLALSLASPVLVICTLSCALLRGRVNDCECCPAVLCWVIVGGIIAGVIALIVNNKKTY